MKKLIATNNGRFMGKWGKYIEKLSKVKGRFLGAFKKISEKMNKDDIKKKMTSIKSNLNIVDKFKQSEAMLPESDQDVTAMKDFVAKFEESIKNFRTQGRACFEAMKAVRANMICVACSAKASIYSETQSSTGAKFRINLDSCNTIVNSCFSTWKMNFQLNAMMQYIKVSISEKKKEKAENKFRSEKEVTVSDLTKMKEIFRSCTFDETSKKLTCGGTTINQEDASKTLCGNAISANNENGYIEGDESIDEDVSEDDVKTADAEISTGKRVLQAAPTPSTNFDVGVTVDTTAGATTYANAASTTSGVVPTDSVSTATAGDVAASFAKVITACGLGLTALLVEFL